MNPESAHSRKAQLRRTAMGQDPIWPLIRRFSLPAIISMTVASSYNLVDAVFIGMLGPVALAAMGATFPLVLALVAVASGTAIGVTSLIARTLGANQRALADRVAGAAITLCFLIAALIAVICLPRLDIMLRLLGANTEVLPLARSYMQVLLAFNLFTNLALILASLIRADGNPLFASSIAIISALLNILLDPILIFGIGPLPALGIQGAAVATVIAQTSGVSVYVCYLSGGRSGYRFSPTYFWPRLTVLVDIYRVGCASIVRSGSQLLVVGVINSTAASFGIIPLAIVGVLMRVNRFLQMPLLGLIQGLLPVIGYNFGARHKSRVAEIIFKTALVGSIWSTAGWVLILLFPNQVIAAFGSHADFLNEGSYALRFYFLASCTLALRMLPGLFFQGIGKGLPATVLTAAQNIVFLLIPVLVLPRYLGLSGLWLAFPVADGLALIFGQIWMQIELRRQGMALFVRNS